VPRTRSVPGRVRRHNQTAGSPGRTSSPLRQGQVLAYTVSYRCQAAPPPWCRCPGLPPSCLPESSHMLSPFRCRPARLRNRQSHLPSRKPLGTGAFRYDSRPGPFPSSNLRDPRRSTHDLTSRTAPTRRAVGTGGRDAPWAPVPARDTSPAAVTAWDTETMSERLTSRTVAPARPPRAPPRRPLARHPRRTRSARCRWH